MATYLGIEIGGTKLQLGVRAAGQRDFTARIRDQVDASAGASGILAKIERGARELCAAHAVDAVGVGFGGPVDLARGVTTTSHQVQGWDNVPLCKKLEEWCQVPAAMDNDCNVAALAEARMGAGQGAGRVFYVTVGTGIGGGFVVDGQLDGNSRPAIAEIGHLRPGTAAVHPTNTVEAVASGPGIAAWTQEQLELGAGSSSLSPEGLTAKLIGEAAVAGDALAQKAFLRATETLGWAIAQVIALLAPEIIVVGGGVSLVGHLFLESLAASTARYVFPPLANSYRIVPAALGEDVVVHGAVEFAISSRSRNG